MCLSSLAVGILQLWLLDTDTDTVTVTPRINLCIIVLTMYPILKLSSALLLLWAHGATADVQSRNVHPDQTAGHDPSENSPPKSNLRSSSAAAEVEDYDYYTLYEELYRKALAKREGRLPSNLRQNPRERDLSGTAPPIQARIVGGQQASQGQFPYFVDMFWCGGVLIAPQVVLTAGHCESYLGLDVLVSGYVYGSTEDGAISARVIEEQRNPNFNPNTLNYDFYLHRLDTSVNLRSSVVLKLNTDPAIPYNNETLTTMGMGYTSENGNRPKDLMYVDVNYVPTNECNKELFDQVTSSMLCAGEPQGGKDACSGDSGGPIVIRNGKINTLVGLVSWGYGCARPNTPGVYSRLSSGMDWIKTVVCNEWKINADWCIDPTPAPTITPTTAQTTAPTTGATVAPTSGTTAGPSDTTNSESNVWLAKKRADNATDVPTLLFNESDLFNETGSFNGSDCVDIMVLLQTDLWPNENSLVISESTIATKRSISGEPLGLNATGLKANMEYMWAQCIELDSNQTCTILNFTDSAGDGLANPGYLLVALGGEVVFNESNVGFGAVLEFGAGC